MVLNKIHKKDKRSTNVVSYSDQIRNTDFYLVVLFVLFENSSPQYNTFVIEFFYSNFYHLFYVPSHSVRDWSYSNVTLHLQSFRKVIFT